MPTVGSAINAIVIAKIAFWLVKREKAHRVGAQLAYIF